MSRGETLVVIPTYNERGNLERLIEEICGQPLGVDLLIVDDSSPDGTGALADALSRRFPLTVIHRPGKLGIGSAHKTGLQYAMTHDYAYVITMDADGSHSPGYLQPMLAQGMAADLVIGSRYVPGGGFRLEWHRRVLTKTVHWLTRTLLGLPYDCTSGLRVYRVEALRPIELRRVSSNGHAFLIELLVALQQHGRRIGEYPMTIQPRREGHSKVSLAELIRAALSLMRLSLGQWTRRV